MTGRFVHIECGLIPAACNCPESQRRPMRLMLERLDPIVIPLPSRAWPSVPGPPATKDDAA